jgi:hypothetical protein
METIALGVGSKGQKLQLTLQKNGVEVNGWVRAVGDATVLADIGFTLPPRAGGPASLNTFYVRSPTEKGLGKKMLCAMLTKYSGLLEGKFIQLEASGGRCPGTHVHTESEADLDAFLAPYPKVVEGLEHDANLETKPEEPQRAPSKEEKGIAVCAMRQNRKLIEYYKTYGFTIVEDHGDYADMRAKAEDVLKACTRSGGAKRSKCKTRRRHRIRRKSFRAFN